jgi:hypothetical protein
MSEESFFQASMSSLQKQIRPVQYKQKELKLLGEFWSADDEQDYLTFDSSAKLAYPSILDNPKLTLTDLKPVF